MAKELAKILKPLVGKSPYHINSTQDFVEQAKHITLAPGECLSSYDVSALFPSVPVDPAPNIIKDLLQKDHTLKERTVMEVSDIILLLEEDGSIPFLDTIVKPEADGTMSITVYRKPTHTDQYLQWDSHHHLSAKFSVIHTLSQ